MDLASLIKQKERTIWREFYPGFRVQLRYIPLSQRRRAIDNAEGATFRGGRNDSRKLVSVLEQQTAEMIKDWVLPAAVAVRLLEVEPEDLADCEFIPCNPENKSVAIKNIDGFSLWVTEEASMLEKFRNEELEAEIKN